MRYLWCTVYVSEFQVISTLGELGVLLNLSEQTWRYLLDKVSEIVLGVACTLPALILVKSENENNCLLLKSCFNIHWFLILIPFNLKFSGIFQCFDAAPDKPAKMTRPQKIPATSSGAAFFKFGSEVKGIESLLYLTRMALSQLLSSGIS